LSQATAKAQPSVVTEVSAIFVDKIILRTPVFDFLNTSARSLIVSAEFSGINIDFAVRGPASGWSINWSCSVEISAMPGRNTSIDGLQGKLFSQATIHAMTVSYKLVIKLVGIHQIQILAR
jgi:hypothetical protein